MAATTVINMPKVIHSRDWQIIFTPILILAFSKLKPIFFPSFDLVFFCFDDIMSVSRNRPIHVLLKFFKFKDS